MEGRYIVLEGIDGCGKTTQVELLKDQIERLGYEVVLVREPGTSEFGEKVRDILLNVSTIDDIERTLLFSANRVYLHRTTILPALQQGKVVISDRSLLSNEVYQGQGEYSVQFRKIQMALHGVLQQPDATILLDIDPVAAEARLHDRDEKRNVLDPKSIEEAMLRRERYLEAAKNKYHRAWTVYADYPPNHVTKMIMQHLLSSDVIGDE